MLTTSIQAQTAEALGKQLEQRTRSLSASTSPIFALTNDGGLEAVGTGIFLQLKDQHFVLSAGHVISRLREERLAIGGDRLIYMNGRFFISPDDDIDLGFFRLSEEQAHALSGARFLTIDDIDLGARPYVRHFYVFGFLAADNSFGPGRQVDVTPVCYMLKPAADGKYSRVRLSRSQHWLYTFDRKSLVAPDGTEQKEIVPEGLSGSGLWQFRTDRTDEKLVALLIEHSERHRVLIATRLKPLLSCLAAFVEGTTR